MERPITSGAMGERLSKPRWLTAPFSRLVVNPMGGAPPLVFDGALPGLQVNAACYEGERPTHIPTLFGWLRGSRADISKSTVMTPPVDFSAHIPDHDSTIQVKPQNAEISLSIPGDDGYGAAMVECQVDLDKTPYLLVEISKVHGGWAVKAEEPGKPDVLLVPEGNAPDGLAVNLRAAMGLTGKRKVTVKLFVTGGKGSHAVFANLRFAGFTKPGTSFATDKATWYPHQIVQTADEYETTTCLTDNDTIAQKLRCGKPGPMVLVGQLSSGKVHWDEANSAVILRTERFTTTITLNRRAKWLGVSGTWQSWLRGKTDHGASYGIWAVQVDGVKAGDEIIASARFKPVGADKGQVIRMDAKAFAQSLAKREADWNTRLARVPHPANFDLKLLPYKGATPASIRRMYYKAWAFTISNILPPMPENEYPYPQFACGKPSLWAEGHPKSRPSAQWESFVAMQMGAYVEPEAAWASFEGMMSLVDSKGTLGGEGLPSRHVQTAWILYSLTGERDRLAKLYPAMKRLLQFKVSDPRWIFKELVPTHQKDVEFVVHALMDITYMQRVCDALNMPEEKAYWEAQGTTMAANYRTWFWETRGGPIYRIYNPDKNERYALNNPWNLTGIVLPPEYLEKPERDSLLALFNGLLDEKVSFLIWNFNKHPSVNHLMYGLWQYGYKDKVALMAEAYMRDITRSGEFAETYDHVSPPKPTGVVPSMFGAANMIDAVMWHNGVILCDGLPTDAHMPGAAGVRNLIVRGKPMNVGVPDSHLPD